METLNKKINILSNNSIELFDKIENDFRYSIVWVNTTEFGWLVCSTNKIDFNSSLNGMDIEVTFDTHAENFSYKYFQQNEEVVYASKYFMCYVSTSEPTRLFDRWCYKTEIITDLKIESIESLRMFEESFDDPEDI